MNKKMMSSSFFNFLFFTYVMIFFGILILSSCETYRKYSFRDYMHIMVYDEEGNAVQGVKFILDDDEVGESDVYGRFILSFSEGSNGEKHTLKGRKAGYRAINEKVVFAKSNVFYFRIGTTDQYFDMAENALDENKLDEALEYIKKCEEIKPTDDVLYLKALILKRLERKDEAISAIKNIRIRNDKLIEEINR